MASTCLAFAVADRDRARLHRLGNLADEIDVEEAVLKARALHLDMVGELEAALEGARGDAAIEHFVALGVVLGLLLALDGEGVFLGLDR